MRLVSVYGDSLSTLDGCNPAGYAVYYDKARQAANGIEGPGDTWWGKVIQVLGGELCVNDSYSGSLVSGDSFPAGTSEERLRALGREGAGPNIVLVYLGINDFGKAVRVSRDGRGPSAGPSPKPDLCTFEDAYGYMLEAMARLHPAAAIVCGTLMRTEMKGMSSEEWSFSRFYAQARLEDYNDAIRRACGESPALLADLAASDVRYETLDGLHATARGHQTMADAWVRCLGELGV